MYLLFNLSQINYNLSIKRELIFYQKKKKICIKKLFIDVNIKLSSICSRLREHDYYSLPCKFSGRRIKFTLQGYLAYFTETLFAMLSLIRERSLQCEIVNTHTHTSILKRGKPTKERSHPPHLAEASP